MTSRRKLARAHKAARVGKKPWRPKTQAPTSLEKAQTFVASGHVHQASMPGKPRGRQRACNRCSPLLRAEQHAPVVRRCGRRRCPGGRRSDRTRRYRRPPPPCSSETLLDNVYAVCQTERTRWRADLERGWRRTGQRELQGPAGAGRFCRSRCVVSRRARLACGFQRGGTRNTIHALPHLGDAHGVRFRMSEELKVFSGQDKSKAPPSQRCWWASAAFFVRQVPRSLGATSGRRCDRDTLAGQGNNACRTWSRLAASNDGQLAQFQIIEFVQTKYSTARCRPLRSSLLPRRQNTPELPLITS